MSFLYKKSNRMVAFLVVIDLTAIDVGLDSGDGFVDYFLGFVEIDFGMIVSIET